MEFLQFVRQKYISKLSNVGNIAQTTLSPNWIMEIFHLFTNKYDIKCVVLSWGIVKTFTIQK